MNKYKEYPGIRYTQKGVELHITCMPSSIACKILALDTAKWDPNQTQFAGFNREIKSSHVKTIVKGLTNPRTLIPNPIIAYFKPGTFTFDGNTPKSDPELGSCIINVPPEFTKNESDPEDKYKPAVIIDGQHRIEALSSRHRESKEPDITVSIVAFCAPNDTNKQKDFDHQVLFMMKLINGALKLSDDEKIVVDQKLGDVEEGVNDDPSGQATLILKSLNESKVLEFAGGGKKSPKNKHFLKMSVIRKILQETIQRDPVRGVFSKGWNASEKERKKAIQILEIYLKAISGIANDMGHWESDPKNQRLYHNVGLNALLYYLDFVNSHTDVISITVPGKILQQGDEGIKKFQKVLKYISFLNWEVDKNLPLESMIQIQQTKNISNSFVQELGTYLKTCQQFETKTKEPKLDYLFEIKNSDGVTIVKQKISIQRNELESYNMKIDDGKLI